MLVFAHQRLDVNNYHGVKNNAEVRKVFESSGKVLAVFQGHSDQNELKDIGGIHYCTLVAMGDGSGAENSGTDPMLVQLLNNKLAIPGNEPVDVSDKKLTLLKAKLDTDLRPVIRDRDFHEFDLERVFRRITDFAAMLQ